MSDWLDGGGGSKRADVLALLGSAEVSDLVAGIVGAGALLSLGLTSDGGALGATVTVDGRSRREYFRDLDELVGWLTDGLKYVESLDLLSPASSGRRKRSRRSD